MKGVHVWDRILQNEGDKQQVVEIIEKKDQPEEKQEKDAVEDKKEDGKEDRPKEGEKELAADRDEGKLLYLATYLKSR